MTLRLNRTATLVFALLQAGKGLGNAGAAPQLDENCARGCGDPANRGDCQAIKASGCGETACVRASLGDGARVG
ncbi:unnamed protein product [Lampetra planeri]